MDFIMPAVLLRKDHPRFRSGCLPGQSIAKPANHPAPGEQTIPRRKVPKTKIPVPAPSVWGGTGWLCGVVR